MTMDPTLPSIAAEVGSPEPLSVQATFVLLYGESNLAGPMDDGSSLPGLEALDLDLAAARIARIQATERRLLGDRYQRAQRVSRRTVGRLPLGTRVREDVIGARPAGPTEPVRRPARPSCGPAPGSGLPITPPRPTAVAGPTPGIGSGWRAPSDRPVGL